jgi:haloacetate dehalogenase
MYDVPGIWRERALDFQGHPLDCGHFIAEERPRETAAEILAFLSDKGPDR